MHVPVSFLRKQLFLSKHVLWPKQSPCFYIFYLSVLWPIQPTYCNVFSYFKVNIKWLYPVGINRKDIVSFKFTGFQLSLYLINLPLPVP